MGQSVDEINLPKQHEKRAYLQEANLNTERYVNCHNSIQLQSQLYKTATLDHRPLQADLITEEKLRKTDELLREKMLELRDLSETTEALKLENDRLVLDLEKTQNELALVEEKKAEMELNMKKEIKCLLELYLSQRNQN